MMATRLRDRLGAEDGVTLIELLMAMICGLIVLGAAVALFTSSYREAPRLSDRNAEIQSARAFADTVARELRQGVAGAASVQTATATSLKLNTYLNVGSTCDPNTQSSTSRACQVTYTCAWNSPATTPATASCTRTVRTTAGGGTFAARKVVDGLSTPNVFCYLPSSSTTTSAIGTCATTPSSTPTYVGINLKYVTDGDDLVIEDGVGLRNPAL